MKLKKETVLQISLLEEEAKKIEEEILTIDKQILEFKSLLESLEEIKKAEKKEILASLGKGVFIKTELKEKNFFVNVGGGVVVKKKHDETKKIIEKQIRELEELKKNLVKELEKIDFSLKKLAEEIESQA